jgi:hypothetical protein
LPPWQSVQPSTTASLLCIVFWSVPTWQEVQPALFASAAAHSCDCGAGGARTRL